MVGSDMTESRDTEDTHMVDPPPYTDTGVGPGREYPGTPRWVKVSGIIALVLVLLVVVMLLFGGGNHGPGRHMPSGDAGSHTLPIAGVARQP